MATLISQQIPFDQVSETTDKEGRYIVVSGKIHDVIITIDRGHRGRHMWWRFEYPYNIRRIISFCTYEKKQKQLRLIDLNKELKDLEIQHKREQKPETLTRIK